MKTFPCPSCGAPVGFQSAVAVFSVCPYCSSMLVRQDLDVELIGKQAVLPEDQSVFQIGTGGVFGKIHFTLQGRLRLAWKDGFWNEWFAWCDDGKTAWLAEAQGFLSFYFQHPDPSGLKLPREEEIKNGQSIVIDKITYEVADKKQAEVSGSQGELPFRAPAGRKSLSCDLNGDNGATATIEYCGKEVRVFTGKYVEFNDFKFSNLRQIEGW